MKMPIFRLAILFLVLASASGCARNAIIELEFTLPPLTVGEPGFVRLEVFEAEYLDGNEDFLHQNDGGLMTVVQFPTTSSPPTVSLAREQVTSAKFAIEAHEEVVAMSARLRFCEDRDWFGCEDRAPEDIRELWLRYEHPFYIGQRTTYRITIDSVPPPGETGARCPNPDWVQDGVCVIDRCKIQGCVGVGSVHDNCTDGVHACEC